MPDQKHEYRSLDFVADLTLPPMATTDGGNREPPAPDLPEVPGYEIISELGRGGMGVVYKARQLSLGRTVALKMVLAGAHAGGEQLARFRLEAETIARIQHPHIVQIYEVNTATSGSGASCPYMALEFVSGGSLEGYLRGNPFAPRQAAAMVLALAEAMHQAHEKGVVHRDLKPGNVLLALQTPTLPASASKTSQPPSSRTSQQVSRPAATLELTVDEITLQVIPKITDFGLAKQMESQSGHTASGAQLGTPGYMAPEQAEGLSKEVGPGADIYALGVILYEMLTGRVPFAGITLMETLVQVINNDPVPPVELQPTVPSDLNTICLRCLAKEPARRYPSALALAEDLQRFLHDEPILARPTSRLENAWRWCRRNPRVALLLTALALTFLGGFVGVTLSWMHAEHLREEAQAQRDQAERNYERALRTVGRFQEEVAENPLLAEPGLEPVRYKLLESIHEFYEAFSAERIHDERLLQELARTMTRMAQERANLDTKARAIDAAQRARLFWEGLAARHPEQWELQSELVRIHWLLGRLHRQNGDRSAALAAYEKALALSRQLNDAQPNVPQYQADLARCLRGLGHAASEAEQWTEAEKLYQQALGILQPLTQKHPYAVEHRRDLAATYTGLGTLLGDAAQITRAEEACRKAIAIQERLALDHPQVAQYGHDLARSHTHLGHVYLHTGRWQEAIPIFASACQAYESLLQKHPAFPDFQRELICNCLQLAELHLRAAQPGLARERVRQSLNLLAQATLVPDAARLRGQSCYLMARIEADYDPDHALEMLEQARKEGYFADPKQREALQTEKDFAPLRARREFQGLLSER